MLNQLLITTVHTSSYVKLITLFLVCLVGTLPTKHERAVDSRVATQGVEVRMVPLRMQPERTQYYSACLCTIQCDLYIIKDVKYELGSMHVHTRPGTTPPGITTFCLIA